ncbi:MAG: DUF4202 domain-containing protein [Actinobacteria bacterium]|nr:DUF4202 domain-containing protein [Actinomycetota bacterium]
MGSDRFEQAMAAIDRANADDPHVLDVQGQTRPKELAHAELMTQWVRRLDPGATQVQLLAARANHLRRWTVPRSSFPEGRAGYLRWRTTLGRQHAEEVAAILASCGYDAATIERVEQIIRKERRATDAQVQTHEDALCLTFLETQFSELAARLGEDKTVAIVRKTLAKMSERAKTAALALPMRPADRRLLELALLPP